MLENIQLKTTVTAIFNLNFLVCVKGNFLNIINDK